MSITRIEVEQVLDRRLGNFLAEASMTSDSGVNPWLTDPLRWALYMLGIETASIVTVTDADLEAVQRSQVDALLDLCELKALEAVQTNYKSITTWVGAVKEDPASFVENLASMILVKRKHVAALYGALLAHPLEQASDTTVRLVSL